MSRTIRFGRTVRAGGQGRTPIRVGPVVIGEIVGSDNQLSRGFRFYWARITNPDARVTLDQAGRLNSLRGDYLDDMKVRVREILL